MAFGRTAAGRHVSAVAFSKQIERLQMEEKQMTFALKAAPKLSEAALPFDCRGCGPAPGQAGNH
jgi:hypothetical protein